MKKISVIGTGHLGSIHAKLWKDNPSVELIGIYDPKEARRNAVAKKFECIAFESVEEAIKRSDAVTIAAPTVNHFEIAAACIRAGKHCLIEKPITASYEEAMQLIGIAKDYKARIQVGHVERFNPVINAVKEYNLKPLFIEAHRLSQFKPRAIDVSVIHDLMIHDIDIILWLSKSKVSQVDANGVNIITETTDIANARITFESGLVANLTASRISANPMRKMRIFQKDAYLSLDFGNHSIDIFRIIDEGTEPQTAVPATMLGTIEAGVKNKNIYFEKPGIRKINAIEEEQKAFIEALETGNPIPVGAHEAAEALRIAEIISDQISHK